MSGDVFGRGGGGGGGHGGGGRGGGGRGRGRGPFYGYGGGWGWGGPWGYGYWDDDDYDDPLLITAAPSTVPDPTAHLVAATHPMTAVPVVHAPVVATTPVIIAPRRRRRFPFWGMRP